MDDLEAILTNDARGSGEAAPVNTGPLRSALARRAVEEGSLDLAYAELDSPVGRLLAVSTPLGLVHLGYPNRDAGDQLEALAARISPRILEAPAGFQPVERQLEEYFEGTRRSFELPLDWQLSSGFARGVLKRTAVIPYGETRTYGEMAASVGKPRAFRAAGTALGSNSIPIIVPCHRVLRSGGALGGYGGGLEIKRKLLELEGALDPN